MKTSKSIEKRKQKMVDEKQMLLKNIEPNDELLIKPILYEKQNIIVAQGLSVYYQERQILKDIDFTLDRGDRIAVIGKNRKREINIT